MWSSRPVGPASGGAVAVGVALLFGSGAFGLFMLNKIARPGHAPLPSPNWIDGAAGADDTRVAAPVPEQAVSEGGDAFDPFDHFELPDVFTPPNMIMGALPKN
ncbi:hypothetical protein [Frigoriglobus tundricola]|uniref:Uncharacterized protein n=1 Tax=Frigoriglobus tundricola TaxID=2774151 RepID=A0A6M5Z397_9BACT|nr:hypothetical protein [Frigoriglobus tundricola]QJX00185.1 hypothetical protein FTUN_7809 [Frigoriglobus tundricola]